MRAERIHEYASSCVTYHTACRRAGAVQYGRLAPLGLSSLPSFDVMHGKLLGVSGEASDILKVANVCVEKDLNP